MAGSVNKVILVGSLGADPDRKPCSRCGSAFDRGKGLSNKQWVGRRFCSKRCAGMRRKVKDVEIVSQYNHGRSSAEIGETFGISAAHILRILKSNGVKIRPASENKSLSHSRPSTKAKLSAAALGRTHKPQAIQKLKALTGKERYNWRAGLTLTGGYLQFTSSPENGCHAGRFVHQVVAEWSVGRPIKEGEHVHHIDGNKLNNDPNNLQVMTASEHAKLHAQQRKLAS